MKSYLGLTLMPGPGEMTILGGGGELLTPQQAEAWIVTLGHLLMFSTRERTAPSVPWDPVRRTSQDVWDSRGAFNSRTGVN